MGEDQLSKEAHLDVVFYDIEQTVSSLAWRKTNTVGEDYLYAVYVKGRGYITVLDRMTGYLGGIRDIETGYRDEKGEFWLASGNRDVRIDCKNSTLREAIAWIKENANTCIGNEDE